MLTASLWVKYYYWLHLPKGETEAQFNKLAQLIGPALEATQTSVSPAALQLYTVTINLCTSVQHVSCHLVFKDLMSSLFP